MKGVFNRINLTVRNKSGKMVNPECMLPNTYTTADNNN